MGSVKSFPLIVAFLFLIGCNIAEPTKEDNSCGEIDAALDKTSFYLRKYQEMSYIELIHETDSALMEKLRVPSLRKLFNLRDNAVRELKKLDDVRQLIDIHQKLVERSVELVPENRKERLIQYSEKIFHSQNAECHKKSFIRLAIYLTIEEAISLNLEDVNS